MLESCTQTDNSSSNSTYDLIIVGASTRAAAQSALRAGYQPWCADLFADLDLRAVAPVVRCDLKDYPIGLLRLIHRAPVDPFTPVLLTGALENYPRVIEAIASDRPLLNSHPQAVCAAAHPRAFARIPMHTGLRICEVHLSSPRREPVTASCQQRRANHRFLLKPRRGTGGRSICWWRPGEPIPYDHYIQPYIDGNPISAVYNHDGRATHLIGATEQIIGKRQFGVEGFRYCGSIGPLSLQPQQHAALEHLGTALSQEHSLRGVFGVDAVVDRNNDIWPIEINPRYTASIEILELATGIPALAPPGVRYGGTAPPQAKDGLVRAKGIVFAQHDGHSPDLYKLFNHQQVADVPVPGAQIWAGWPICTLLTRGPNSETCLRDLHAMAKQLYHHLAR